jgi:NTE family protein
MSLFRKKKTALVLGSGGAKGVAHIAVIEYLEKMNINVDMCVGASIGSVIGAVYGCGNLMELKEDLLGFTKSRMRSLLDPVFPRSGLLEGKKIMKYLEQFIPKDTNIEDLPFPMAIAATDFYNARTVAFTRGNLLQAVRASISIPGIFVPVKFRDTWLIDGGVTNPLPINLARHLGADFTVAVNLNGTVGAGQMKSYYKKFDDQTDLIVEGWETKKKSSKELAMEKPPVRADWLKAMEGWLSFHSSDNPHIFDTVARTVDIMGYTTTRLMLKYEKPTVLIEPDVLDIGILEFEKTSQGLTEGFLAADAARRILKKKIASKV